MAADERRPRDVNSLAARIVAEATGQVDKTEPPAERPGKTVKAAPRKDTKR